jgi:hypothetical protein
VGLKSKLLNSGVRVYKGTPTLPLAEPALFLGIVNTAKDGKRASTIASLSLARPGAKGYAIKELISNMELDAESAVEKAIDIAVRGGIKTIYLNANLTKLPIAVSETA